MTADAASLKTMAENVSRRTEWIEGEIRKQTTGTKPSRADLDAANARVMSLSGELQAALANAMTLSRELAAAKEELHHHEKRAIKLSAEVQRHTEALATAQDQIQRMQQEADTARGEIAELRAELAEAWAMGGNLKPEELRGTTSQLPATIPLNGSDIAARARRIEEDLRFERMHVQQLEQRLSSWRGLAGALLRKVTRLGAGKTRPAKAPSRQRLKQAPATSR
jgi:chromosome segregation ATPase